MLARVPARLGRALSIALSIGSAVVSVGACDGYDVPLPAFGPCNVDQDCPSTQACDELTLTCALKGDADCRANEEPSQGDACTQDCTTATCSSDRGRRVCTCSGGVFVQCACLPPEDWPYDDVPAAPYCDRLSGEPRYMNTGICKVEGQTCASSTAPDQGCVCQLVPNTNPPTAKWACGATEALGIGAGAAECESLGSGMQSTLTKKPCDQEWDLCITRDWNPEGTTPRGCMCVEDGGLEWYCGSTNRWYRAE